MYLNCLFKTIPNFDQNLKFNSDKNNLTYDADA